MMDFGPTAVYNAERLGCRNDSCTISWVHCFCLTCV